MKTKRKFTWLVSYYNVHAGSVEYRSFYETVDDINWLVDSFLEDNGGYILSVFKLYKRK